MTPRCTLILAISLALAHGSCSDRQPRWSLSADARQGLVHRSRTFAAEGVAAPHTATACHAILTLHLPHRPVPREPETVLWHERLEQLLDVELTCSGSCGEPRQCAVQHLVDSPDPQYATTGCICEPRSPPPCRLAVRWTLTEENQRVIEEVRCGPPGEPEGCVLDWLVAPDRVEITCQRAL